MVARMFMALLLQFETMEARTCTQPMHAATLLHSSSSSVPVLHPLTAQNSLVHTGGLSPGCHGAGLPPPWIQA